MKKELYRRYCHMKERCYNPKDKRYHRYGGRGIKICDEWLEDYEKFEKWSLENGYEQNLVLDRINNDGDYSPNNCRYVTISENNQNRCTTKYFTYNGKTQNLAQWCEEYKLNYHTVLCRLRRGWEFEKAITQPLIKGRDKKSLIGKKFDRLFVLDYAGDKNIGKDNNSKWICKCDCGNVVIVGDWKLKSGHTKSCGCYQKEKAKDRMNNDNPMKKINS